MKKNKIFPITFFSLLVFNTLCFSQSDVNLPDLIVEISAPTKAFAGETISRKIKMTVKNIGSSAAPGTKGTLNPPKGYMIDYVFSTDEYIPKRFAVFSLNFREDVLLQGGRRSHTFDLASSESTEYLNGAVIPKDTPRGKYYICAQVDPGNKVEEENEENNIMCLAIEIESPNSEPKN